MLSYQHGYHAGGPADIHKHFALARLLVALTRKDRGISYIESHAGRGVYDLESAEALKTGEWRAGLGAAQRDDTAGEPYWLALDRIRAAFGATACPGSPAIAAALLRSQDRMTLMELHPAEHAGLKSALKGKAYRAEPQIEIHRRDGIEGVLATSPPTPRRGLVLIDPSYERKSEYQEIADFAIELRRKWPEAAIMIWYPILLANRHSVLIEALADEKIEADLDEVRFAPHGGRQTGMSGSGLVLINPPFGYYEKNVDALTTDGPETS